MQKEKTYQIKSVLDYIDLGAYTGAELHQGITIEMKAGPSVTVLECRII